MKERPILFSGPMVRALLAGTKTQTRRAFSPRMEKLMRAAAAMGEVSHFLDEGSMQPNDLDYVRSFCPYGQPGDRLWVRESHWWFKDECDHETGYYPPALTADDVEYRADGESKRHGWRPSIHMPRWASRILLEITGVRVERLQDVSEADCRAEGAHGGHGSIPGYGYSATPLEHFRHIWVSTGGDWDANPWVWVVEFKRVQQASSGRPSQLEDAPCNE